MWNMESKQKQQHEVYIFQFNCLRKMYRIRWPVVISNKGIKNTTAKVKTYMQKYREEGGTG